MLLNLMYLLAAGQVAAAPVASKLTSQQQFDAASTAAAEGRCSDAIPQFEALEASGAAKRSALVAAAIDVRKGVCLGRTGNSAEAERLIQRGAPVLAAKGPAFADDLRIAHRLLGTIYSSRFDYSAAAAEYKLALELSQGRDRYAPLMALAQLLTFDEGDDALRYATEARTLALADATLPKGDLANVQTQYARVLMNRHREQEAYAELKDSLNKQGGLSNRVTVGDVVTRSDLAIAAMLNGDPTAARNYLAYTGAGRLRNGFGHALDMEAPLCGPSTGLTPRDFAIVQFHLQDDGAVSSAQPIYTSGDRRVALEFAKAVSRWSWRSEDAKLVPAPLRYAMRVELRCTASGERPPLTAPLDEAFADWLERQGQSSTPWRADSDARAVPLARQALASARAAGNRPAMVQALFWLGHNGLLPDDERRTLLAEAMSVAQTANAPVVVTTRIALAAAEVGGTGRRDYVTALRTLAASPTVQQEPLALATVRLLIAEPRSLNGMLRATTQDDADALLSGVIDEPKLPAAHPLKVAALLQRANMLSAKGNLTEAQAAFAQTGLTEDQCSLIGLTPAARSLGVSSSDYPNEAIRLGFEGWVQLEFDVSADGKPVEPRALIAYPPFVFDDAAMHMGSGFRYQSSYRPTGKLACSANRQSIAFSLGR